MKLSKFHILSVALFGCLLTFLNAESQSLIITDCQGFTRAAKQVQPGTENQVKVDVESGPGSEGSQATLTNQVNGEVVTGTVQNGVVTFEGISSGVYSITFVSEDILISSIAISGVGVGVVGASAALLGAAVVGGGVVVGGAEIINEVVDATDGSNNNDSPTPIPTPIPQPTDIPNTPRPRATPTPNDCPVCDPDLEPPPLDNPFPTDELPKGLSDRNRPKAEELLYKPLSPHS